MIRILHIVDSLDMGGIQTFLLNVYSHINRELVQFDFLVFRPHKQVLEGEFVSLGSKIYKLPNWRKGILKNRKALRNFFEQHKEYKIIHYHAGTLVDIAPIKAAYAANIPCRVIHSHNTKAAGGPWNKYAHLIHKKSISKYATDYFACGKEAAKWMFSGVARCETAKVINNGIDTVKYLYNESIRNKKRNELNIENNYVIGHVGRFSVEKNQSFLVEVFAEVCKKRSDAILIFAGDGSERETVEKKAKELQVYERVKFLGIRKDVKELLQAFDVFSLPSLFEGFPVVLVEAQAAGLPCIISDSISSEVIINPNVQMLSLSEEKEKWVDALIDSNKRFEDPEKIISAGFDINSTAQVLTEFYLSRDDNDK